MSDEAGPPTNADRPADRDDAVPADACSADIVNIKEHRRQMLIAESRRAAAPLVAALAQHGLLVEHVSDLYNRPMDYEAAIPLLLDWLPRMTDAAVRIEIIRALSVKWAKPIAAKPIVDLFPQLDEYGSWVAGSALSVVADDSVFEEIAALFRDRRWGTARQMLADALAGMKHPDVGAQLLAQLDDPTVAGHVVAALRKLKTPAPPETRARLEPFLTHKMPWVRNAAKKAIARLDRPATTRPRRA